MSPHDDISRLELADIEAASRRIAGVVRHTPLLYSETFSAYTGARVFLKAENLQRGGAYKLRGAYNRMAQLPPERAERGVIAASAGNHGLGVALAGSLLHIPTTIVMPLGAPLTKVSAAERYGARVVLQGDSLEEALSSAHELEQAEGLSFIHPYDDWEVIAGQGTVALEILEDLPEVDLILVPVGGGGLISGLTVACRTLRPEAEVVGVQAAGAASFIASRERGEATALPTAETIADGIKVKQPGRLTWPVVRDLVARVVAVDDATIARAIVELLERSRLVVEGAGAVGVAALLAAACVPLPGSTVAVVLSGGNIDLNLITRIIQHGLTAAGRYLVLRVLLPDRPGQLLALLQPLAERQVNILSIEHHRAGLSIPIDRTEVVLQLETRGPEQCLDLVQALRSRGWDVEVLTIGPITE